MTTITRERLTKILIETMALIKERSSRTGDASGISTEVNASLFAEVTRMALASITAEPVAYTEKCEITNMQATGLYLRGFPNNSQGRDIALYIAQLAPVVPTFDEWLEVRGNKPLGWVKDSMREAYDACRDAKGSQPVSNRDELPPGIKPAPYLDSVAKNAKSPPGNSPVIPDDVLSAVRKVARIRADFDDFDGDRRGIGDCLDEAEQDLIVTINKHASVIAAAPQQEVNS